MHQQNSNYQSTLHLFGTFYHKEFQNVKQAVTKRDDFPPQLKHNSHFTLVTLNKKASRQKKITKPQRNHKGEEHFQMGRKQKPKLETGAEGQLHFLQSSWHRNEKFCISSRQQDLHEVLNDCSGMGTSCLYHHERRISIWKWTKSTKTCHLFSFLDFLFF